MTENIHGFKVGDLITPAVEITLEMIEGWFIIPDQKYLPIKGKPYKVTEVSSYQVRLEINKPSWLYRSNVFKHFDPRVEIKKIDELIELL